MVARARAARPQRICEGGCPLSLKIFFFFSLFLAGRGRSPPHERPMSDGGATSSGDSSAEDAVARLREEQGKRMKETMHWVVAKMCEEESRGSGKRFSKEFVYCLHELAFDWVKRVGRDLELFARHAGRKRVSPDDVLLVVRRNESARESLEACTGGGDDRPVEVRAGKREARAKKRRRPTVVVSDSGDEVVNTNGPQAAKARTRHVPVPPFPDDSASDDS